MLPGVAFALAGGHHRDPVGPGAPVLTLQPDPLGTGPVDDAAPLLGLPPAPVFPSAPSDPVRQQVGRKTLPGTHQLLHWVETGALPIRDVLGGS